MSITETRPAADEAAAPVVTRNAAADWFTSADHKRIGVAWLWTSLLFAVVAGVAVLVLRAEMFSTGIDFLDGGKDAQYYTLLYTSAFYLFLLPAFLGLATYLIPLQIGARRLAFPRLHAFAYWLYLGGGGIVVASYLVRGGPYSAQALFTRPGAATGGQASDLWVLGMGAVVAALLMTALGLIATITALRAPGMRLEFAPVFTWSTLVTSVVLTLALPVFLAGLVLHGTNLNTSGRLFAGSAMGNVWAHTFWFWMRPEILVLLVIAAGVVSEVVSTFARNRLLAYVPALGLVAATGALTFVVWAYDRVQPGAPLAPTFSIQSALLYAPLGLLVLMWLGTVATGRPRPSVALVHAVGAVILLAVALAGGISGLVVPVKGGTAWAEGHTFVLLFGVPAFALAAGIYYWAPKIWGRFLNEALGYLQFLVLLVGMLLSTVPYYTGLRDLKRFAVDASGDQLTYGRLVAAGDVLVVIALLLFAVNVLMAALGRGRVAAADAWEEGATLEWLAASPPTPWNFADDEVPAVRSEQPLLDLRTSGGAD